MDELWEILDPKAPDSIELNDKLVQQSNRERLLKELFNNKIYCYLRNTKKTPGDISREDIDKMSKWYNKHVKQLFLQQIVRVIKTQYGKPLQWIKDNRKSVLLNQIEDGKRAREQNQVWGWWDPH